MGAKFAHVTILDCTMEELSGFIESQKNTSMEQTDGNDTLVQFFAQYISSYAFYVGPNSDKAITIVSDHFFLESIENFSTLLSQEINKAILAIVYFEGGILAFSIYRQGKSVIKHASGNVETYSLKTVLEDPEILAQLLSIPEKQAELEAILTLEDLNEQVEKLEELTGLSLWLTLPMLNDELPEDWMMAGETAV